MPPKPRTFPEIKALMISFDLMPRQDEDVMRMARYDLSRMKGVTKQKKAISMSNAYRVWRSDRQVKIEFLDRQQPEERQVKMRFICEFMLPFC